MARNRVDVTPMMFAQSMRENHVRGTTVSILDNEPLRLAVELAARARAHSRLARAAFAGVDAKSRAANDKD